MRLCCPPGRGCNAPEGLDEPCLLELCVRRRDYPECARTLARWSALQTTGRAARGRERRHLRRAYERARERALHRLLIFPSR